MGMRELTIGGHYTNIKDTNKSAEIITFKVLELEDCDNEYGHDDIKSVVYVDEDMNCQVMQIDLFANSFK